jgi:hypothetical protein
LGDFKLTDFFNTTSAGVDTFPGFKAGITF